MKSKNYILILVLLAAFSSCKKELTAPGSVIASTSNKSTIVPYSFDWELGDYMPAPAGTNILVPWASSANRSFPLIYATDIKKSDGWELVYNTFSPQEFKQPAYFVLYNRYRGLLRAYFYLTPNSPIPSSYVSHSLVQNTNGSDANVLSYSGSEFTNLDTNNNVTTLTQPYRTSSTGTWYAQEFEMAYDPAVGSKNATTNLMTWNVNSVNITQIILNGTSQGTIKGTIATPNPPLNILNQVFTGGLQVLGVTTVSGLIGSGLSGMVTDGLKKSISEGLQGNIKNTSNAIFSSLTGGANPDSTKQYVNLTTSVNYKFSGTATDIYQIANPSMVIPGSLSQETVAGYSPLYTSPLGIMSLSHSPTASFKTVMGRDGYDVYDLTFNPNDYSIQWNPSIINSQPSGASIANLKTQILSFEDYYDNNYTEVVQPFTHPNVEQGSRPFYNDALGPNNAIKFKAYFSGSSEGNSYTISWAPMTVGKPLPNHVLRISFDVIPNNGAPKVTIAKSFKIILKSYDAS